LGLADYYQRFLPDFFKAARPLTNLLKKDIKFERTDAQELAFLSLKNSLCSEPLLQYSDFTQSFLITTDASKYAIGGILSQDITSLKRGRTKLFHYQKRIIGNSIQRNFFPTVSIWI